MKLIRFVLDQSLLMNLLTLLVLVVGAYLAMNMRREAFPTISFDIVTIQAIYPGASPQEVEQLVVQPLEDEIETVNGIKEYDSVAIEGFGIITVTLDPNRSAKEKEKTVTDIQRAVDRVDDLPDDMPNRPLVEEVKSTDLPVIEIGLSGLDYAGLSRHADQLIRRLEELPDVSRVIWRSQREREMWVEVNQDKLRRYGLSLGSLIAALRARNINLPGGAVPVGDREVLVRTVGELLTAEQIGAVVLRANDAGVSVRVRDVAVVTDTFEEAQRLYRINGGDSVNLSVIINSSSGDIIDLVAKTMDVANHYVATANEPGLKVAYANDMSYFVKNRLGVLVNNGKVGIALVLAVLVLFLSKGIAFVTALGLPVAFLGTIMAMAYLGVTINLISMFGLIIVLGMLVDDAIIVAENIWQHYEDGKSPRQATVDGTSEVFWPVMATVLTTMAAFTPLLMISGIFGKFIRGMPIVVMIALAVSLIEAMAVLPSHAYDILRWRECWRSRSKRGLRGVREHRSLPGAELVARGYAAMLRVVLKGRYVFTPLLVAALAGTLWFAKTHMHFVLFPANAIDAFFVRVEMPTGTSLDDTAAAMLPIDHLVAKLPAEELKDFVTYVGIIQNDVNDPFTKRGSHVGQVAIYLTPEMQRARTTAQIIDAMRPRLDAIATEQGYERFGFEQVRPGPPVGKPVAVRIKGENLDTLNTIAKIVAAELQHVAGTSDVDINYQRGKDEVQVVIDDDAAARALVTVQDVALHVNAAFEGQVATVLRTGGEQVPLRIRLDSQGRDDLATLHSIRILNAAGNLIPLAEIARFERAPGITQITHRDGQRTISVTATLNERVTTSQQVNEALKPMVTRLMDAHPDITIELGGEYEDTNESIDSLRAAFWVAFGLIFIILATQFQSLTQPFVVMAAIPFAIIGVIWAFWLHGMPLSFLGVIGVIGLSGVVVNDSIVLVSFLNTARAGGMPAFEAAMYAGKRRFRAVWLTTLTTVFGLLPLVYGIGGMDKFLQPAALALGYGLLFGTVLILFVVPALYLIRVDIGRLLGKLVPEAARSHD